MHIQFAFRGKNADVPCSIGDTIKLYTVSTPYSSDGFYAAAWRFPEVEPYPACLDKDVELISHVAVQEGQNGQPILSGYLNQEVTAYATL